MSEKKSSDASSVKYFRSYYLFLGVYLIAKTDYKDRWLLSNKCRTPKSPYIDDPKDYSDSYSRMIDFFQEKIDNYQKISSAKDYSIRSFSQTFDYYCETYVGILGKPENYKSRLSTDFLTYMLQTQDPSQSEYYNLFKHEIENSPDPFKNKNVIDYLQLLWLNYSITGNEPLKHQIENLGRSAFRRSFNITKPKGKPFRWHNKTIYDDQKMFIWVLENPDNTVTNQKYDYIDEYYSNIKYSDDEDCKENKFLKFRGEIFPIYYWLFRFILDGNPIEIDIQKVKKFLYLINEAIDYTLRFVGEKQALPEKNLNEGVLGYKTWQDVGTFPDLPF